MKFWDDYWFGSVAAVRPYLLSRGLLFVLAADLWFLQPSRAAPIGMYGFDVSHFVWLDFLQPLPTPELKFAVILLTGFAAAVTAMTGSRVTLFAVVLLFTYSWAMSMQDMLQHHYFLSLALLCVACMPKVRASDLWTRSRDFRALSNEAGSAVAREGPRTSAFGFVLMGVTLGIVYFFAAVTKTHGEWLSGASLIAFGGTEAMVGPVVRLFEPLGVGEAAIWAAVGTGSVAAESFVSICYFTAAWRDRTRPELRTWWLAAGATAISMHLSFMYMNLWIGWFTYYMFLLAGIFFFPERWLLGLGRWITWPVLWVQAHVAPHIDRRAGSGFVAAAALLVGLGLVGLSLQMDIPGSLATGLIPAVCLLGVTANWIVRGAPTRAVVWLFATSAAGLAMVATIVNSNVRFFYYEDRIDYVIETERRDAALETFARYERYAPPDLFYAYERLGDLALRLELPDEAIRHLRRAIELDPDHVATLNNLAWMLATREGGEPRDVEEAIGHAKHAADLTERSDAEVLDTLATAYAADTQFAAAIEAATDALAVAGKAGAEALMREIRERLEEYAAAEARFSDRRD